MTAERQNILRATKDRKLLKCYFNQNNLLARSSTINLGPGLYFLTFLTDLLSQCEIFDNKCDGNKQNEKKI